MENHGDSQLIKMEHDLSRWADYARADVTVSQKFNYF